MTAHVQSTIAWAICVYMYMFIALQGGSFNPANLHVATLKTFIFQRGRFEMYRNISREVNVLEEAITQSHALHELGMASTRGHVQPTNPTYSQITSYATAMTVVYTIIL